MTQPYDFEGKNIDHAIEKACETLRVTKEKLKYDVLSYGSTGIFGLVGSKKARIRVMHPETPKNPGRKNVPPLSEPMPSEHLETPAVRDPESGPVLEAEPNLETVTAQGKSFLEQILSAITEGTRIEVEADTDPIAYNVQGGNSALLIGKRGQTLEDIQYLTEQVAIRNTTYHLRIRVDVEGYQKNRRISLERLAEKMSQKVKRTGKPAILGDMNAAERRIVHMALKDDREVRTQSRGEGVLKKISIVPRKKSPSKP